MAWCEAEGLGYVLGVARNPRLEAKLKRALRKSHGRFVATGKRSRRFREFRYRTRDSWSRRRRVIGKAEWLAKGANPRFVVTNLPHSRAGKQTLYEKLYNARGDMENRIKEQQLDLFAGRTSTATLAGNQLRLYFSSCAYVLMCAMRRLALTGTRHAKAQCGTIRVRLLKIAARLRITHRTIWLALLQPIPGRTTSPRRSTTSGDDRSLRRPDRGRHPSTDSRPQPRPQRRSATGEVCLHPPRDPRISRTEPPGESPEPLAAASLPAPDHTSEHERASPTDETTKTPPNC